MPSIRYINQSAPFWDFIANMEEQGSQQPFFSGASRGEGPPAWGWGGPQHWHRGPPPHHHRGDAGEGPSNTSPPPPEGANPPPPSGPDGHPPPPPPPGADHDGPFAHRPHPHPHHRRGGYHGRRGRGGFGGPWGAHGFGGGLGGLEAFLNTQLFGNNNEDTNNTNNEEATRASEDFKPEADVFDTDASFIIHISLPGAKKEDVGVNWDAEKSELSVAGVVYRPGDEDFLKTLALDERKVGAFEKKIRLGTRANAAQVDADGISAKLEDGVLRVDVPKLDRDYVEIKKVDIE